MGFPTVFSQIIKAIPRTEFESWVHKHNGDHGTRTLNCWTWFGALLFGQLTGHDSIRAIERVFAHGDSQLKNLGFGPVRKSTLADANHTRPLEILEEAFQYALATARRHIPKKAAGFEAIAGNIFAMDSTTIELCLSLSPWAKFRRDAGAAKLHTAIDIAGDLPHFAVITHGKKTDGAVAWQQRKIFHRGDIVIVDRGYVDFGWFDELNRAGTFFVTRTKTNLLFKVYESRPTDRTQGHICDQLVYPTGLGGKRFKGKLRRISYRDPDTGKKLTFLTNHFELPTQTICDLYKARWKVELFFKSMKQYLRIKKFIGTSYHAVKAQILVALIAYLLIQALRFQLKSNISAPDAMAVIGVLLLLKEPLSKILGRLPRVTRHPRGDQLRLNL